MKTPKLKLTLISLISNFSRSNFQELADNVLWEITDRFFSQKNIQRVN